MKSKSSAVRRIKSMFDWQKQKEVLTFDGYLSFLNDKREKILGSFGDLPRAADEYAQCEVDEWIVLVQERDEALQDWHAEINQKLLRNCIASMFCHMKEFMDLRSSNADWIGADTVDSMRLLAQNLKRDYDASFVRGTGPGRRGSSLGRMAKSPESNSEQPNRAGEGNIPNGHLPGPGGDTAHANELRLSTSAQPDLEHALAGCVPREEMQEALQAQENILRSQLQSPVVKESQNDAKGQRSGSTNDEEQELIQLEGSPNGRDSPACIPKERLFPTVLKAATRGISAPLQAQVANAGLSSILTNGHAWNRTSSVALSDDEYMSVRSGTRSQSSSILPGGFGHQGHVYNASGFAWLRAADSHASRLVEEDRKSDKSTGSVD